MKIKLTFVDKNNGKTKRIILSDTDGDSLEIIRKHLSDFPNNWESRISMADIIDVIAYRLGKGNLSIQQIKNLVDIHDNLLIAKRTLENHADTLKQMLVSSTIPNLKIMQYLENITF